VLTATKSILIGNRRFDISGVGEDDPYFSAITDTFEPEFTRICNDFVCDDYVCVDIGANIGIKTLLLAQYVPNGRVIAIEAAPTVASLLNLNIDRGGMKNITIVETAVGDTDGMTRFADQSAYGHISSSGVEVPVQRLSSLVAAQNLERLDFVKIDVEGYEFPILRNSIELLNHHQSIVLFEFNSWCQTWMSEVSPKDFINWTLGQFSNVYAIRHNAGENYLQRLSADGARNFLHTNMVHDGLVTDLLVTNFEGRLSLSPSARQSKVTMVLPQPDMPAADQEAADTIAPEADTVAPEEDMMVTQRDQLVADWNSWHATRRRLVSLTGTRLRERLGRLSRAT
jgi:FkbM family methyltransferase